MSDDYLEQLDSSSLGLLAEATGMSSRCEAGRFFAHRPKGIRVALSAPEALDLLAGAAPGHDDRQHRLLKIAIAVHQTAQEICSAGWTARDDSPVDLPLLGFAGQGVNQAFMVDLLAAYVPDNWSIPELDDARTRCDHGSVDRLRELIALCNDVAETERAGGLRLLGDEALFTVSICPAVAANTPVTPDLVAEIESVLPKAVRSLLDELSPDMQSLLDLYLTLGPIWYRMAAQNLLHRPMREQLGEMCREFSSARRFLVRVAQGPLSSLHENLFAYAF